MSIPESEFSAIISELIRRPLEVNKYRLKSGSGRTQTFGIVNRRCLPPDASRQNWLRPYLYYLLLEFAKKHVPETIPWNAITVNQNYKAAPHYDRGNIGPSYLIAFGEYQGGELEILEENSPLKGVYDVCRKPLITDFSKLLHSVKGWIGNRFSLVFYTLDTNKRFVTDTPTCSVVKVDDKYLFQRNGVVINGLPHPLKGRVKVVKEDIELSFN